MSSNNLCRTTLMLLTALAFSISACQKASNGEIGPAGPAGPKGDAGTANVIYSPWATVNFSGSGTSYTGNLTAPQLTQEVLDKADIRVYWREGGRVLSLPYSQVIGGTAYSVHHRFYVGRIELVSSYALSAQQMRYVIIPGGTPTGRRVAVDLNDYAAVKAAYNLPD